MRIVFALLLLGCLIANSSAFACGTERWPVKVGDDPDAVRADLKRDVPATIADLIAIPVPASRPEDGRAGQTEDSLFVIEATLTSYKLEADGDYHLVLRDQAGHTMIAEIPDPACVGEASPFRDGIRNARAEFDARLHAGDRFRSVNLEVWVMGVGFFDFDHHQRGVAPNAIELHPVLDIRFADGAGP